MRAFGDGQWRRSFWLLVGIGDRPWLQATGLAGLLAVLAAQAARAWRYFPMFMGDQGWYLQVAARIGRGEVLYRDVAWAYGPLPAQTLGATFRWLGPDAGWATALNALLAGLSLLLVYTALRHVLRASAALGLTAFAALAGPYVGGDLIRAHLYAYTQAVSWGMAMSPASLVAVLRWQRSARASWAAAAGLLAGLAFLSKPEFGLAAAGAALAVLATGRAPARAWIGCLAAGGVTLAAGFGWQASASGWPLLWRGYLGYDMISQGRFWGAGIGSRRWLASIAGFWLVLSALWAGASRSRWRPLLTIAAALVLALTAALIAPVLLAPSLADSSAPLAVWSTAPGRALQWLVAVPWSLLTPALVAAAWIGRRRRFPAAWWGVWAFALLVNLRLLLTGYSSGLALAPGLAVLGRLLMVEPRPGDRGRSNHHEVCLRRLGQSTQIDFATVAAVSTAERIALGSNQANQGNRRPSVSERRRWPRAAAALLVVLAAANLLGQALTPDVAFNAPRRWLDTSLGPVAMPASPQTATLAEIQAELPWRVPVGETIFATGWGAGWYLLAGRANPTAFDVVLDGLGVDAPEAAALLAALERRPPAAVLMPSEQWHVALPGSRRGRDIDAAAVRAGLARWWDTLAHNYVEAPSPAGADWVLLVRR